MRPKKWSVSFALLVLLTGYGHCLAEMAELDADEQTVSSSGHQKPFPDNCEHSGCICQGAVLADDFCKEQSLEQGTDFCVEISREISVVERPIRFTAVSREQKRPAFLLKQSFLL